MVVVARFERLLARSAEVALRDNPKCPDRRERAAVLAVELIGVITGVQHQFALEAAREVEPLDEHVPWVVVALLVTRRVERIHVAIRRVAVPSLVVDVVAVTRIIVTVTWIEAVVEHSLLLPEPIDTFNRNRCVAVVLRGVRADRGDGWRVDWDAPNWFVWGAFVRAVGRRRQAAPRRSTGRSAATNARLLSVIARRRGSRKQVRTDPFVGCSTAVELGCSQASVNNIEQLETDLWAAADNLRANSKLTSSEYCMPVLGVIFLRHATNRYDDAVRQIEADQAAGAMPKRPLVKGDFLKRRALRLPLEARYDTLLALPTGANLGAAIVKAMDAIERDFEPLKGQLPKDYDKFASDLLGDLLRVFDSATLRTAGGDVFGRIYEYFLMKFAMQGAQDNGEFFTPPSLVQVLVNVIEPDQGVVLDH
jgi:hypothetical protein